MFLASARALGASGWGTRGLPSERNRRYGARSHRLGVRAELRKRLDKCSRSASLIPAITSIEVACTCASMRSTSFRASSVILTRSFLRSSGCGSRRTNPRRSNVSRSDVMLPLVSSRRSPITFGGSGSPAPSMTASACQPLKERLPIADLWRRSNSARLTDDVRARFNKTSLADLLAPGNSTSKCAAWRSGSGLGCAFSGRLRGEDLTDHHCGLADHSDIVHGGLQRGIRDEAQNSLA